MPKLLSVLEPYYENASVTVYCGDCMHILPRLGQSFDFVFCDPPFNIGHKYRGFVDRKPREQFTHSVFNWVGYVQKTCNGVFCLHGNDDLCELYLEAAQTLQLYRIAWINWHYRFGQCGRSNWIDARCHCLIYSTVGNNHTWNPDEVLVQSDRVMYGDKRVDETERGGKRLPGTVWGIPSDGPNWGRVQGNNTERRGSHPNQLPEVYLERLIRAYTNVGSLVCDPYGGSGTTAVVSQALGRRCITIDISEENCRSIVERLEKGSVRV